MVDRTVLAAVARVLSMTNSGDDLPRDPAEVAVIQPTAIGDTLLASGTVAAIAERYPDAGLRVFHGSSNASAIAMVDARFEPVECDFRRPWSALRTLHASRPDLIVDLTPWPNLTAIMARLSAPCTVGFAPAGSARGGLFDRAVPHRIDRHELDNHAAMARLFAPGAAYRMRVRTHPCSLAESLPLDRLMICHLAAGGRRAADKAWPVEHWAALCRKLVAAGYVPAFTGVEADRAGIDRLRDLLGTAASDTVTLAGRVPLIELGDLLRRARLTLSVDTSVIHLAGAVDARVVGLHGPTRSWRWGARCRNAIGLDSPHPAAGYIHYGNEAVPESGEIMRALTPEAVADAVFAALNA